MNRFLDKILSDRRINYKAFYVLSLIYFIMALFAIMYTHLYGIKFDYILLLSAESCVLSSFGLLSMGISLFYILGIIQKDY